MPPRVRRSMQVGEYESVAGGTRSARGAFLMYERFPPFFCSYQKLLLYAQPGANQMGHIVISSDYGHLIPRADGIRTAVEMRYASARFCQNECGGRVVPGHQTVVDHELSFPSQNIGVLSGSASDGRQDLKVSTHSLVDGVTQAVRHVPVEQGSARCMFQHVTRNSNAYAV